MRIASSSGGNPGRRYLQEEADAGSTRSWMADSHRALALAYVWGRIDGGDRGYVDQDDFANGYAEAFRMTLMDETHLLPDVETAYAEWRDHKTITLWGDTLAVITEDSIAKAPSYDNESPFREGEHNVSSIGSGGSGSWGGDAG